jgi:hypothetical protein
VIFSTHHSDSEILPGTRSILLIDQLVRSNYGVIIHGVTAPYLLHNYAVLRSRFEGTSEATLKLQCSAFVSELESFLRGLSVPVWYR